MRLHCLNFWGRRAPPSESVACAHDSEPPPGGLASGSLRFATAWAGRLSASCGGLAFGSLRFAAGWAGRLRTLCVVLVASGAFFLLSRAEAEPVAPAETARVLRVCADPNNLPFSNERGEGFENALADLVAREMHATVQYTWWAQRRGFFRSTLRERVCDVVLGVPAHMEMVLTTRPYYRSSYAFVYQKSRGFGIRSLDDARLRSLRVGVQLVGDDGINTPPVHALTRRNIVDNVVGFSLYGDYSKPNPPARIIDAVSRGEVDVAIAWGPLAGYFAQRASVPLEVVPVSPRIDAGTPLSFDIAMGVRHGDVALRNELDRVLRHKQREIRAILARFGVPQRRR